MTNAKALKVLETGNATYLSRAEATELGLPSRRFASQQPILWRRDSWAVQHHNWWGAYGVAMALAIFGSFALGVALWLACHI